MPDRLLGTVEITEANDLRFQFEIIKGLAESVREQTKGIAKIQDQMMDMVLRLERIEAKETAEAVARLEARIDALEASEHRREGAAGVVGALLKSPTLGWIVGAGTAAWAVLTGKLHL